MIVFSVFRITPLNLTLNKNMQCEDFVPQKQVSRFQLLSIQFSDNTLKHSYSVKRRVRIRTPDVGQQFPNRRDRPLANSRGRN